MEALKLPLDTQIVLWWLDDNPRLRERWRDAIQTNASDVLVSVASLWEILIKIRIGKLRGNLAEIEKALDEDRFRRLAILSNHLEVLSSLPMHHRDPFDHLLVAQAISEDAALVSDDRAMRLYPVELL